MYCRAASYTNAQTTANTPGNYMMLGEPAALVQSGAYRAQQMTAPQQPKYPPPLIPVCRLNGALRYDGSQYGQGMDVVDLAVYVNHSNVHYTGCPPNTRE